MDTFDFSKRYEGGDLDVATFLCGLDQEKHIKSFYRQDINLEIFLTLDENDLRFIGIDNEKDVRCIADGIKRLRRTNKYPSSADTHLSEVDILRMADYSRKQVAGLQGAVGHVLWKMQNREGCRRNLLLQGHNSAHLVRTICKEAVLQNVGFLDRIHGLRVLLKDSGTRLDYGSKRRTGQAAIMVAVSLALLTASALQLHRIWSAG